MSGNSLAPVVTERSLGFGWENRLNVTHSGLMSSYIARTTPARTSMSASDTAVRPSLAAYASAQRVAPAIVRVVVDARHRPAAVDDQRQVLPDRRDVRAHVIVASPLADVDGAVGAHHERRRPIHERGRSCAPV